MNLHLVVDNDAHPEVECDLYEGRESYSWVVIRCHYCGRQHQHGAGTLREGNPERYLGGRVPHCCRNGGTRPDYILVPSEAAREELAGIRERAARKAQGKEPAWGELSLTKASLAAATRTPLWLQAAGLMRSAADILEREGERRLDSAAWRCADAGALLRLAIEHQYSPEDARECLSKTGRGAQLPRMSAACKRSELRAMCEVGK